LCTLPPPLPPLFPYTTLFRSFMNIAIQNTTGKTQTATQLMNEARARISDIVQATNVNWEGEFLFSGIDSGSLPLNDPFRPSPSTDRKSTRLNSSHVKISYAVF